MGRESDHKGAGSGGGGADNRAIKESNWEGGIYSVSWIIVDESVWVGAFIRHVSGTYLGSAVGILEDIHDCC